MRHTRDDMMTDDDLGVRLVSVKEDPARCSFHRWEVGRYRVGTPVRVSLSAAFDAADGREGAVELRLEAFYVAERGGLLRPLMRYAASFVFDVCDAVHRLMLTPTAVYIPPEILRVMMGVGVGALRGMLAVQTRGTFLADHPLPIMSVGEILTNVQGASPRARESMPCVKVSV